MSSLVDRTLPSTFYIDVCQRQSKQQKQQKRNALQLRIRDWSNSHSKWLIWLTVKEEMTNLLRF
jgi:hypothetical protein